MASFFISHSSRDQTVAAELRDRLRSWGYASMFLDFHPEDGIPVGEDWEKELYLQVRSCDAIIFLGSPASVASCWCIAELALARASHKSVFPLWLGGNRDARPVGDLQWLDVSGTDQDYERLRRVLLDHFDPRVAYAWDVRRKPYPGLKPFQREDAAVFFGREKKVDEVLGSLDPHVGARCVAVIGPSGSGKSSLVRAGVIPRLLQATNAWAVIPPFTPGERPVAALSRVLAEALQQHTGMAIDRRVLQARIEHSPSELTEAVRDVATVRGQSRAVLLVIDQAEELVSLAGSELRDRFVGLLRATLRERSPLYVLATLRTEFLGTSLQQASLDELVQQTVLLGPLDRARLPQVIEGPARKAGIEFDAGLVARMVEDTRGGDALPLLAYTLEQLYEGGAAKDRHITHQEYDATGGVLGTLQSHADAVASHLKQEGYGASLLPTLVKLTTLDADGEPGRRPLDRADLTPPEIRVVEEFIDARLLTIDGSVIQVAHEALLRTWQPLREAIAASRQRLRVQADLSRLARDWDAAGRRDSYLLPEERVQAVRAALTNSFTEAAPLTGLEGEFFDASARLADRLREAERRRRRLTFIGLTTALVVISFAGLFTFVQYKVAHRQTALALSRGLAAQAVATLDDKLDLGLLLALEAWRSADTVDARSAAATALQRGDGITAVLRTPSYGMVSALALSPTQPVVAIGGGDGAIRVWDLRARELAIPVLVVSGKDARSSGNEISQLSFSPDGRDLAVLYDSGEVSLWRVSPGSRPRHDSFRHSLGEWVTAVTFSPDSKTLAATAQNGKVAMWDVATGAPKRSLDTSRANTSPQIYAWFSEPSTLLTLSIGGRLTAWDLQQGVWRRSERVSPTWVTAATFTPKGARLALLDTAGGVSLWDTRSWVRLSRVHDESLASLPSLASPWSRARPMAIAADGSRMTVIDDDGRAHVFRLPELAQETVPAIIARATSVDFSRNGGELFLGGRDLTTIWKPGHTHTLHSEGKPYGGPIAFTNETPMRLVYADLLKGIVRVWRLPERAQTQTLRIGKADEVVVSTDGNTIASNYRGRISVWHTADRQRAQTFVADEADDIGLSADGRLLATASRDGLLRLWDVQAGKELGRPVRGGAWAWEWPLAFSPHGDVLASFDDRRQIVRLWRVAGGRDGTRHLEPIKTPADLTGHTNTVTALAFSPDGAVLASGGYDSTVRLWNVETGRLLNEPLAAGAYVSTVAFSPDGRTLASGGSDGKVRLWDVRSGRLLGGPLKTAGDRVASVAFSANGHQLASVAASTVELWDRTLWSGDFEAVSNRICASVSRNLTAAEWRQFLGDTTYRRTCDQWAAG